MPRDPDKQYRYARLIGTLGPIPLMLGVGPLLGFFAGRWLDERIGTGPWLQVLLMILGLGAAVRYLVTALQRVRRDLDQM